MPTVGPALPPALAEKRKRDESDSSDNEGPSSPDSAGKRPRIIGPAMPPAPLDERPPGSPPKSDDEHNTDDESSDDDDFGPALPTAADSKRHPKTPQAAATAPAKATLQRDEWMTMAPASGDWSARVDPTQLKARKFNSGKGAKAPSSASEPSDAWHETPEQKQARLQRELMGVKDKSSASSAPAKPAHSPEDVATAQRLRDYNTVRGPSLYNAHQKKDGREEDDDPSKRAFDREKDIAGGLQLNSTQRRDMMKKASDFGSRFSSAKYL